MLSNKTERKYKYIPSLNSFLKYHDQDYVKECITFYIALVKCFKMDTFNPKFAKFECFSFNVYGTKIGNES